MIAWYIILALEIIKFLAYMFKRGIVTLKCKWYFYLPCYLYMAFSSSTVCWLLNHRVCNKHLENLKDTETWPISLCEMLCGQTACKKSIARQKKQEFSLGCKTYVIIRKQHFEMYWFPMESILFCMHEMTIKSELFFFFRFDFGSLRLSKFRNRGQWRVSSISKYSSLR